MTLPARARLVAYLRDSGGPDQDLSLRQQEEAIRAWCAEHGHQLSEVFSDEALSGTSTAGRRGFNAMLQHFRSPGCEDHGLVIWKFSRLARDFDDAQFFKADLRRRGFDIVAIKDKIPEGSMGRFFEAAIDYMNERYSQDLSGDVQRGLRHALINYGCIPGNRTKPGFMREQVIVGTKRNGQPHTCHRWVVDPKTAPKVLDAFRMKAAGATAKEIHAKHQLYSTVQSYSYLWQDEIYIGTLHFGADPDDEIVIENYVEAIVDQETWRAVQHIVEQYKQKHRSSPHHPRRKTSRFRLSGLVNCERCGYALVGGSSKNPYGQRFGYYTCKSGRMRPHLSCETYGISAGKLEKAVLGSVKEYILAEENLNRIHAAATVAARQQSNGDKGADLRKRQANVDKELANIVKAIAAAGHSKSLVSRLQELETERDDIAAQLEDFVARPKATPPSRNEVTASAEAILGKLEQDRPTTQRILRGLIRDIEVYREGKRLFGTIHYLMPSTEIRSTDRGSQNPTTFTYNFEASLLNRQDPAE